MWKQDSLNFILLILNVGDVDVIPWLEVKYLFVVFGGTSSIRIVADGDFGRAARVILKDSLKLTTSIYT